MKKVIASMIALAGVASVATAQTYEDNASRLSFQVYNSVTNMWGNTLDAAPGQTVQLRVVASYVGTRTDIFAMGEALYQPTLSNADNTGAGADADQLGGYRNGGNGGNSVAGSMLTEAEGNQGAGLADYGRVRFGATANTATSFNTMTMFRHTGGSDGAPAGSFIRMAGIFVSTWPRVLNPVPPVDVLPDDTNRILRGISSNQVSQALNSVFHVAGSSNIVLFRQAVTLSNDPAGRTLSFSTFQESLRRVGSPTGPTEPDDRRYISWQTGSADNGTHRGLAVFQPGSITVVPAPGAAALLGLGGLIAARRRRA